MGASDQSSRFEVVVIGGGIAGISAAYELAADHSVLLLEREDQLAYHTTGRSAALFVETHGNAEVCALANASRAFYENPPAGFDGPLLRPRPFLQFAAPGRGALVEQQFELVSQLVPDARLLSPDEIAALVPFARADRMALGMLEPGACEIDVAAVHQGYRRGLQQRGGRIERNAHVTALDWIGDDWVIGTARGESFRGNDLVDAAGAWSDEIAGLAGLPPVGLTPMRRSVFMAARPADLRLDHTPVFVDIDNSFYIKPEGAQLLCSPADETPSPPEDARPDTEEIARAIDAINETTTLALRSITTSWAGQRTFAPDRRFVYGTDPDHPHFHWFCGQGGFGLETAPAAARYLATMVRNAPPSADLIDRGFDPARTDPARLR